MGMAVSYAPKRPKITKTVRAFILEREGGKCYLCGQPIIGDDFDADHELARELGGSDLDSNLRPAHKACHRDKSKADVALIAKSNRLRKKHGLDPVTRKPGRKIQSPGFQPGHRPMQGRSSFQTRKL